jgi:PAS domain S-box-containing protein
MDEAEQLKCQLAELEKKLAIVEQEKTDLEILLETSTYHHDLMLYEVRQDKRDLELILETAAEHSDAIEVDLFNQAAEAKHLAEEQFQMMAESTLVGLMVVRAQDGQILYVNAAACDLMQATATQLLNQRTPYLYSPDDRQTIIHNLLHHQRFQGEVPCYREDGSVFWALVSLRPFRFQGEDTILTALNDISDRKSAEAALKLAEERYRSIFENALEGIFQANASGHYIRVNPAMAQIYGYESTSAFTEHQPTLNDKQWAEPILQDHYHQLMAQYDQVQAFEYQCYRQDGSVIWVAENSRVVRQDNGDILYYEGIIQDISARKQAEDALKQQVQKLQIEIDQAKRDREVKNISQTDYFQHLMAEADSLRF